MEARLAQSIPLPTDIASLTLAPGGTFDVTLVNTLGLDLLRPAPGRSGELILTLRGGGALLASDTLRGSNRALPNGGQLTAALALPAGARLSGPVDLQLDLHLPTGGFVTIDRAAGLAVTVTPRDLRATTVVMRVFEAPVRAAPTTLRFADVPAGLRSALQQAVLELNVEGADAFTGSFTLSFRSESGAPILRPIQVPLATPTTSVTSDRMPCRLWSTTRSSCWSWRARCGAGRPTAWCRSPPRRSSASPPASSSLPSSTSEGPAMRPTRRFAILSLLWLAPAGLAAQTVAGGARAAGLSDAHGALARGPAAALVNPANLGLPGNPAAALQLPAMSLAGSAHPIGLGEIAAYSNAVLPRPVRESWLARIPAGGAFHAAAALDLEVVGLSLGPIAVTASQIAEASATVPRDAVKLLFFGNGADGVRHPIDFRRARVDASRVSVVSAAAGLPLRRWDGGRHALAAGLTAKRVLGHGLLALRDAGADFGAEPVALDLRFPTVIASDTTRWVQSAGWGVDAGLAYAGPRVALGLTVTDLANTFRWDRGPVTVRDGRAWVTTDDAGLAFTPSRWMTRRSTTRSPRWRATWLGPPVSGRPLAWRSPGARLRG